MTKEFWNTQSWGSENALSKQGNLVRAARAVILIVEKRSYQIKPGKEAEFVSLYEAKGWPAQSRILGHCVGYYQVDIGSLSGVLHLWSYIDFEDRAARRVELGRNADWAEFLGQALPLLDSMTTEILRPAPFFQASLEEMRKAVARGTAETPSSQNKE